MTAKKLHIVCFDVPYPADHGGMFDLFYKIVSLHQLGLQITLHCFEYGKGEQDELKKYSTEVYYYKRSTGIRGLSFFLPYIVSSRRNKQLIENLSVDDAPILLEGTHSTYLLYKNLFPQRTILYRLHNIEQVYYRHLYKAEEKFSLKKAYYGIESRLLKKYEANVLKKASAVLPVSKNDTAKIRKLFPLIAVHYISVFLPFQKMSSIEGYGSYCLYQGNLSIAENEKTVTWLVKKVLPIDMPLVIAGKNPSKKLIKLLKEKNIALIANPSDEDMLRLIQQAHINIIFSFNNTGIKLKLLNAVFHGRHCIANEAALSDPDLKACCNIASTEREMNQLISNLKSKPFTKSEIDVREKILATHFNNHRNAQQLSALL